MAKTVHARTIAVQSLDYKYGKIVVPPYEVDIEFTPLEEAALDSGVTADMIPNDAGANNQFATEDYVDEKVSEYSARFLGTSDPGLTELEFLDWADTLNPDNNDYCNWQTVDLSNKTIYKRYKYNGTAWLYEYDVADPSSIPTTLAELSDDSTHRVVTDTEKTSWSGKAEISDIPTALSAFSDDSTHRLATDTEKGTWNGKQDPATSLSGYGITDAYTKTEADAKFIASTAARSLVVLTQAQYDTLTPEAETLYYIIEL